MKFIRNALVGIAIYEAAKYLWNMRTPSFTFEAEVPNTNTMPHTRIRKGETDDLLETGSDPNAALNGQKADPDSDDPWKNSLADDELRAPDS